ncbi:MAG TPA: hypothetical protein VI029_15200, partial [Mycobacterium sp.]
MRLHDIPHSRAGDKGDTSDISVIAYRSEDYELLHTHLTAQRVADHFHDIAHAAVDRYEISQLFASNLFFTTPSAAAYPAPSTSTPTEKPSAPHCSIWNWTYEAT